MSKAEFEAAEGGVTVTFQCPKCKRKGDVRVIKFDLEPVLTGNGDWVETWFLKVYGVCDGCEWSGTRAVGKFRARGTNRLAKETK